jgi:hypothetical protein
LFGLFFFGFHPHLPQSSGRGKPRCSPGLLCEEMRKGATLADAVEQILGYFSLKILEL